jgi:hypothetical protein
LRWGLMNCFPGLASEVARIIGTWYHQQSLLNDSAYGGRYKFSQTLIFFFFFCL